MPHAPDLPADEPGGPPLDPTTDPSWTDRVALLASPPALAPAWRRPLAAGAAVLAVAVLGLVLLRPAPAPPELSLPMATGAPAPTAAAGGGVGTAPPASTTTTGRVTVHAAGAVARPGVYRLAPGTRVADALDAAGGPLGDADLDRLNLAAVLVDGAQVHVPRIGQPLVAVPGAVAGPAGGATTPASPLDLNGATADELDGLPGVGPAIAAAIVQERERRGGFTAVDELLDVRGIGEARLAELRDLVRV